MYPIGYIHARNKLECMGLITEFRITTIMLNRGKRKIINTIDPRSDKLSPYKRKYKEHYVCI